MHFEAFLGDQRLRIPTEPTDAASLSNIYGSTTTTGNSCSGYLVSTSSEEFNRRGARRLGLRIRSERFDQRRTPLGRPAIDRPHGLADVLRSGLKFRKVPLRAIHAALRRQAQMIRRDEKTLDNLKLSHRFR